MEEKFLRDHPELRQFVLSDIQLTGSKIGEGAYGQVDEVAFPVGAAAKTIHAILQQGELTKAAAEFVRECQLMSTLCHPNVVQFLGVAFFPGSRLPALVMERLLMSLHDLLAPEIPPLPGATSPLAFFSAVLKCSVLHNVACGLAYLHERSPPVIHRDLSARNVLLNWDMVAKIADLGVARIIPRISIPVTMTKGPGASVYMPPEASAPAESNKEKSIYDASIDIFSLGVVTFFTIGGTFPCNPLPHNYVDERSGLLVARTELQRHSGYMAGVNQQLRACGQLRGDHPLIRLIQQCLHNGPHRRPSIREVLRLLEEARAGFRDGESRERDVIWYELFRPSPGTRCVLRDLVTENADLQSRVVELQSRHQSVEREFQSRVQTKDRELAETQQELRQKDEQLTSKEAELTTKKAKLTKREAVLTRAEETIRREQRQNQEMRQRAKEKAKQQLRQKETELVQAKERVQQQLRQKEQQLTRQGAELTRQGAELTRQGADLMRAEETIRREQQEMRQRETELVQAKDRAQQQLRQKEDEFFENKQRDIDEIHQQWQHKMSEREQHLEEKERELELAQLQMLEKDELVRDTHQPMFHLASEIQEEEKACSDSEEQPCPDDENEPEPIILPPVENEDKEAQKKRATNLEIEKADLQYGELLGEGGGGTVYRGTWRSKGIRVALKKVRLSPDHCDAKILAKLGEHPNIVSFLGFLYEYPDTTIVIALAKNGSLYRYLYEYHKVPTLEQSLKWARQIAYGMAHIHKLGIVHRDLKSSNILFSEDMEVQICDFGLSRPMPNTTTPSKTAGTWRWMAPEIADGKKANIMCDVFSYAMVVWELMEHKVPFYYQKADIKASMCILNGERPTFTFQWPEYLRDVVKSSWSQDMYHRPSFAEIIISLKHKTYFRF